MSQSPELWRPVVGYEGRYAVSSLGRVRNIKGLLSLVQTREGYLVVGLFDGKKQKQHRVHRLVLTAFVGPPPSPLHQANHLDFRRDHNALTNLEWVTPAENVAHAQRHGRLTGARGERNGRSKLTTADVRRMRRMYHKTRPTYARLANRFGVAAATAWRVVRGRRWGHVA